LSRFLFLIFDPYFLLFPSQSLGFLEIKPNRTRAETGPVPISGIDGGVFSAGQGRGIKGSGENFQSLFRPLVT